MENFSGPETKDQKGVSAGVFKRQKVTSRCDNSCHTLIQELSEHMDENSLPTKQIIGLN